MRKNKNQSTSEKMMGTEEPPYRVCIQCTKEATGQENALDTTADNMLSKFGELDTKEVDFQTLPRQDGPVLQNSRFTEKSVSAVSQTEKSFFQVKSLKCHLLKRNTREYEQHLTDKEITALCNEVLENRLGQTIIVQQVEQKLDDTNYVQSLDSRKDLVRRYGKQLLTIHAVQKLGTNNGPSEEPKALPLKWLTDEPVWPMKTCLTAIPGHPGKKMGHTSSTVLDPICLISTDTPARGSGTDFNQVGDFKVSDTLT
ncbi:hypothetical protein H671_8g19591 [Cricetulus griseus]|nr:hypothetical protein H671_8g19591 [Cricetulus griseus]